MVGIDHIGVAARDAESSARALAEILGVGEPVADGADGDMFRIDLAHGASLYFSTSAAVGPEHIAFRVDPAQLEIVSRLRARGLSFGNDPENPRNGETTDPLGAAGRAYFVDANGHLFEVVC